MEGGKINLLTTSVVLLREGPRSAWAAGHKKKRRACTPQHTRTRQQDHCHPHPVLFVPQFGQQKPAVCSASAKSHHHTARQLASHRAQCGGCGCEVTLGNSLCASTRSRSGTVVFLAWKSWTGGGERRGGRCGVVRR